MNTVRFLIGANHANIGFYIWDCALDFLISPIETGLATTQPLHLMKHLWDRHEHRGIGGLDLDHSPRDRNCNHK